MVGRMVESAETNVVFVPVRAAVLTISDTRTPETDISGDAIATRLRDAGHDVAARSIVTDDQARITAALRGYVEDSGIDVVIATGGTGVTARDVTPEALAPLVDKPIPGFGELFRWLSFEQIGTSTIQSRAEAALCGGTYVFLLPGSPRAVALAMDRILLPQLDIRHRPCNFVELLPRIRGARQ
jgi:molybdenum cofactor biosynthesis protein B